jgi:cell division protein FtsW (lipid II flippase)
VIALCVVMVATVAVPLLIATIGWRWVAVLLGAILCAGCGMFEQRIEYKPYPVKVPIEVPCAADLPADPVWATKDMPRVDPKTGENLDVAVDKLTAERKQRIGHEAKLKEAVKGCQ